MLRKLKVKIVFSLLFLIFPFTLSGIEVRAADHQNVSKQKTLKIATWNIERFCQKGDYDRDSKDLKEIAKILERYDFIAITELMHNKDVLGFTDKFKDGKIIKVKDGKVLESQDGKVFIEVKDERYSEFDLKGVMENLSKPKSEYHCLISPKVGWDKQIKEHYAFLYDTKVINIEEIGNLYPDSTDPNVGTFIRNPYWSTFRACDFYFSVIVVHLYGSKPVRREREIKKLVEVYDWVQGENGPYKNDVLLVGDFNQTPKKGINNLPAGKKDVFDDLEKIMKVLFYKENGCKSTTAAAKPLYDNILFEKKELTEYTSNCGIYLFDLDKPYDLKCCEKTVEKIDVPEGNSKDFEEISNHYPVWAEFRIDCDDVGDSESVESQ